MKSAVLASLSVFALGAVALHAANFWQKKKFSEWTEKEAQHLLQDSPWAKPVEVRMGGMAPQMPGGGRRGRGGGMGNISDASSGPQMGGEPGGGGRRGGGSELDRGAMPAPGLMVVVRCHSALPIKEAVARLRYGAEAGTSPEAAKGLSRQEAYYIIGVAGLPARALRDVKDKLKESALLKVKGKAPIAAEMVRPDVQGGRAAVYAFFPRKGNVILVEDKDFEFELKLPALTIKRTFKLKDMVYNGKLEI